MKMSEINVVVPFQLSGVDSPLMTSELEALHQHKFSLEKRCSELTEALRVIGVERDQAAEQYQQYVSQLNNQLHSLNQKASMIFTALLHASCVPLFLAKLSEPLSERGTKHFNL